MIEITRRRLLGAALSGGVGVVLSGAGAGAELRVVSSGGFAAAYKVLAPQFEKASGTPLITGWGPSMGTTKDAIPVRLARGEAIDVVIMVGYALGALIQQGRVLAGSQVELARSGIGVVVKAGATHPDITTVEALKRALLAANSVAYSDSASGVYIQNTLFPRLDLVGAMASKARMIPAEPVGAVVARGEAALGFQQISELKPIQGIDLVGPLPPEVQQITVFSGAIVAGSSEVKAAEALLAFLSSPQAAPAIAESGLEPVVR
jgi:molybdate transport system substrate-binding protein